MFGGSGNAAQIKLAVVHESIAPRSSGFVRLQHSDWRDVIGGDGKPVLWGVLNDSGRAIPAGTRAYIVPVQADWRIIHMLD